MNRESAAEKYAGSIRQNQQTHVACILLLDTSDSMNYPRSNPPINGLNRAVDEFIRQAGADEHSKNTFDISIIEFNSKVNVVSRFRPVSEITPPLLNAHGCTCMGEALIKAVEIAKKKTREYQLVGTDAWIPWIVMITDGEPTDNMDQAKAILEAEKQKGKYGHVRLWIIATDGANLKLCKELTKRVIYLKDHNYSQIFDWTRESLATMSVSRPGQSFQMPPLPKNAQVIPDDWSV